MGCGDPAKSNQKKGQRTNKTPTSLSDFLKENSLLQGIPEALSPVFSSGKRQFMHLYDLFEPTFIYRNRNSHDESTMFNHGLIPFGHCGNGDFIVVDARSDSNTSGMVCILSHDYALEHTDEIKTILPQILRPIADSINSFIDQLESPNCDLPADYLDGNLNPFVPAYMKRGKRAP